MAVAIEEDTNRRTTDERPSSYASESNGKNSGVMLNYFWSKRFVRDHGTIFPQIHVTHVLGVSQRGHYNHNTPTDYGVLYERMTDPSGRAV